MDLSREDQENLLELDNRIHHLLVGWGYLRAHLRRALKNGEDLARLAVPEVRACVRQAGARDLPLETPRLQLFDVNCLNDEHVLYRIRETTPSALAAALVGPGLLEARICRGPNDDWRLLSLKAVDAQDPDHPVYDSLYTAASKP